MSLPPAPEGPAALPDLSSLFLGPKAENADVFERLLLEAFRDHVFWRRNFHPEDGLSVSERERRAPGYEQSLATLSEELLHLLGELKGGVPFFSPRHIGHMASDLTMASLIGYMATLLYNPNNVAAEASPVTTRLENEVAAQLSAMVGYPRATQWGHLTSGGTVANFEALWAARTTRYLPVAVAWAAEETGLRDFEVQRADGTRARVRELGLWELLNVPASAALDAVESLSARLGDTGRCERLLQAHSLGHLGAQEFGRRLAERFGDALPSAAVLVPATAHYSWEKLCRALGIGGAQRVTVPVDDAFRMDTGALEETLRDMARRRQPVLACVSVIGSTEESAVDRLDVVAGLRKQLARELGLSLWLHADAAWGGYAASVTRGPDGRRRTCWQAQEAYGGWPRSEVFDALCALEHTDSVTIDPHKLGFVPYPAGALCYRDGRVRFPLASDAPYVFHAGLSVQASLGRYSLEGSRPGAAAAGVWMSHRVLPLDARGYGQLVGATAMGARALHQKLGEVPFEPFRVVTLPAPDLNIVCFAVGHPSLRTLEESNALVDRIHQAMSLGSDAERGPLDYLVSRTVLRSGEYGASGVPVAQALGFSEADYQRAGGVHLLRCTVMNPFLAQPRGRTDFLEGFVRCLRRVMREQLAPVSEATTAR